MDPQWPHFMWGQDPSSACSTCRTPWKLTLCSPPPPAICPQIGLQSVYIIDAGETALVEGLRVAPWERGKGVAGVLQRFCSAMVKEKHPEVKVSRLTRDDKLGPKDLRKYRIIAKQVNEPCSGTACPFGGEAEEGGRRTKYTKGLCS